MISSLHPTVQVLAQKEGARPREIRGLQSCFPELPLSFTELLAEATEIEMSYKGKYLRLYGPAKCIEMNDAYEISKRIPGAIPVGDTGGGEVMIFLPHPERGIYKVGYGSLTLEDAEFVALNLEDLLLLAEVDATKIGGVDA